LTQKLLFFKNLVQKTEFFFSKIKKQMSNKEKKLDSLLTAREDGERFKPYFTAS
jgi:hypothetical protein